MRIVASIRRISVAIVLGALIVSGCAPQAARSLHQGDTDYPELNSSAQDIVQLTVIIPAGFPEPKFWLRYVIDVNNDNGHFTAPPGCSWTSSKQFYLRMPIKLERSGNVYRGSFAEDRFLSGRCAWHLDDLESSLLYPSMGLPAVMFFEHSLWTNAHPLPSLDLASSSSNLWCSRHFIRPVGFGSGGYFRPPPGNIECARSVPDGTDGVPTSFYMSIPPEQRLMNIHGTQYLRRLTVEFHDLDTLVPAFIQRRR